MYFGNVSCTVESVSLTTVIYVRRKSRARLSSTLKFTRMSPAQTTINRMLCIHEIYCVELLKKNTAFERSIQKFEESKGDNMEI